MKEDDSRSDEEKLVARYRVFKGEFDRWAESGGEEVGDYVVSGEGTGIEAGK